MKLISSLALSLIAAATAAAQQPKPKPVAPAKPATAATQPATTPQPPAAPKADTKPAAPKADAKTAARRADGTTATVEDIKDAQKALAAKGLYKGAVSGRLNKDFKAALKTYQKQNNLKPTGRLNQETLAKLRQG